MKWVLQGFCPSALLALFLEFKLGSYKGRLMGMWYINGSILFIHLMLKNAKTIPLSAQNTNKNFEKKNKLKSVAIQGRNCISLNSVSASFGGGGVIHDYDHRHMFHLKKPHHTGSHRVFEKITEGETWATRAPHFPTETLISIWYPGTATGERRVDLSTLPPPPNPPPPPPKKKVKKKIQSQEIFVKTVFPSTPDQKLYL